MKICVEIEKLDDGTYTVHECEPKEEMPMEQEGEEGQSYADIGEALKAAAEILLGPDQQDQQDGFEQQFADEPRVSPQKPMMGAKY